MLPLIMPTSQWKCWLSSLSSIISVTSQQHHSLKQLAGIVLSCSHLLNSFFEPSVIPGLFISFFHSAATLTLIVAGKAIVVHCKDMHNALISLLTGVREVENRKQIVAASDLGFTDLTRKIISRETLTWLDAMCVEKGIVGDPVIFQTHEDKKAKKISMVGTGATAPEKALLWIIGESHPLCCFIFKL